MLNTAKTQLFLTGAQSDLIAQTAQINQIAAHFCLKPRY